MRLLLRSAPSQTVISYCNYSVQCLYFSWIFNTLFNFVNNALKNLENYNKINNIIKWISDVLQLVDFKTLILNL
jgi:hypothetical protein